MFLYMSSPIRACLLNEGEIQHRGGPSASGAPIEGLDMGISKKLSENVGFSSIALQNSVSQSVSESVDIETLHIDPVPLT